MRKYAMIAVGGFWGAILRFLIKSIDMQVWNLYLPINTLIINILGCIILGFFITISEDMLKLKEEEKLGVVTGFLGAFTTFSSISKEISVQIATGQVWAAGLYIGLSIALGLLSVLAGVGIGSKLVLCKQKLQD